MKEENKIQCDACECWVDFDEDAELCEVCPSYYCDDCRKTCIKDMFVDRYTACVKCRPPRELLKKVQSKVVS